MRNTFGHIFTLTTFGESHGEAVGGVVDGMPAGIDIDMEFIQSELNRRRPGQSAITTSRQEADKVELLSGVFEGKSTGCPIGFIVRNTNQHSQDYENMRCLFRPSHADYTYYQKYGIRDHRGGGRSSARITISRCVGGALAKLVLRQKGITVQAYTSQVGDIALDRDYTKYNLDLTETNAVRCPDAEKAAQMEQLISQVKAEGDTIGGIITCVIKGCPAGLGEPEFGKLHAALGSAMLSINAVKGFEYGDGFDSATMRGKTQNDVFCNEDDHGVVARACLERDGVGPWTGEMDHVVATLRGDGDSLGVSGCIIGDGLLHLTDGNDLASAVLIGQGAQGDCQRLAVQRVVAVGGGAITLGGDSLIDGA
jgi:chorismate synthase